MKQYLIILFILQILAFEAFGLEEQVRCPGPKMPKHFDNPRLISNWLRASGKHVKTIEEFVCCLPDAFQKQYIIGHSSVAAQNGTPNSPRVIMFDVKEEKGVFAPKRMLTMSFNGGEMLRSEICLQDLRHKNS